MILIAIKDNVDKNQIITQLNKYFEGKDKPPYKLINKLEKFNSWTPLLIDPQKYDLEEELIEFLSTKLGSTVFGYEHQDTVNLYTIYLYSSGECVDELSTLDGEISKTYGYFSYLDDLTNEEKSDLDTNEVLEAYYKQLGFDPDYISFEDQY